jgi:hypothetical protein
MAHTFRKENKENLIWCTTCGGVLFRGLKLGDYCHREVEEMEFQHYLKNTKRKEKKKSVQQKSIKGMPADCGRLSPFIIDQAADENSDWDEVPFFPPPWNRV